RAWAAGRGCSGLVEGGEQGSQRCLIVFLQRLAARRHVVASRLGQRNLFRELRAARAGVRDAMLERRLLRLVEPALGERGTLFALLALQRGVRARFLLEQAFELAPVQLQPHEGDEARARDGAALLGEQVEVA